MFIGEPQVTKDDVHKVGDALILGENREMFFLLRKENDGGVLKYYLLSDRKEYAYTHAFRLKEYTFYNTGRNYLL